MTTTQAVPLFKTLSRDECESVLLRNNVGRLAFAVHDRVSIVPVNYGFFDGWIYGRTTSSRKLQQILRNRRVAFEVDEYSELFAWKSVIVHGPLYVVQPDTTERNRRVYDTAVSLIRHLVPEALTEADPAPFRDQLFRIHAVEITGRASTPYGGQSLVASNGAAVFETTFAEDDASLLEQAELAVERTGVPEDDVHIEVFDGVVVLSGTVETQRDRQTIEAEILAAPAVVAVVNELETILPVRQESLPSELARSAIKELRHSPNVLSPALKVVIDHGWLRLEGSVSSERQRMDVIRRMRAVEGARGVIDRTRIVARAV